MTRAEVLIDGGYLLKRLSAARPDVDAADAEAVAVAVSQLVRSHLNQLNKVHRVLDACSLLYWTFRRDARPYRGKT